MLKIILAEVQATNSWTISNHSCFFSADISICLQYIVLHSTVLYVLGSEAPEPSPTNYRDQLLVRYGLLAAKMTPRRKLAILAIKIIHKRKPAILASDL